MALVSKKSTTTWRLENALKHLVMELYCRLHADEKEVNGPDHG